MGRAKIISGGPTGRYTIEIDTGEEQRSALVARYTEAIAKADELLEKKAERRAELQLSLSTATTIYEAYEQSMIAAAQAGAAANIVESINRDLRGRRLNVTAAQIALLMHDRKTAELRAKRQDLMRARADYAALVLTSRRDAWCLNLTEDAPAGSTVATVEVPGESDLILLQQECRAWQPSDGLLAARELLQFDQAYYNVALLPGWQKWRPTYRSGTITSIDRDADTASVALASATSSAQRLDVNQTDELENVPFDYQPCNNNAFLEGDNVIVRFGSQDWAQPRIVGFVSDPRGCNFSCLGEGIPGSGLLGGLAFRSDDPVLHLLLLSTGLDVQARVNRGPWFSLANNGYTAGVFAGFSAHFYNNNPANTLDNIQFNVYRSTVPGEPIPDRLSAGVQPPYAPGDPPVPLTTRNVAEFVIRIAGQIVLNFAMEDRGWFGLDNYRTGAVRCPGGIRLHPSGSWPVTRLDGYTLLTDETP